MVPNISHAIELGVARLDVTPTEPIRLTGYAARKAPHVGVEQKLWVKALAIGSDREGPAVLLTLDNCGISEETWREVRDRLGKSAKIRPDRVVIASSHTHSGPATKGWAPNIFVRDLTAEEQGAIDRYTTELVARLEKVALDALKNRQPGRLSWSQGSAAFAANRRTRGGPVDHAVPVLKAEGADGRLLALVANYACHCTTLGGEFNHVCGDWAGYAQEAIEHEAPGAVALVTIGCGADSNPSPRGGADGGLALAKKHGGEIGAEVKRLLGLSFTPLTTGLSTQAKEIELPFGPHFTRDQWLARSTNSGIVGYHGKKWLARLDRGETLPASLYYPITAWNLGDELAMVFLPGEVVVDYALRLKRELDAQRLWVTGYANYVPCYIPSRRILAEGGYEAEDSLWYYDRPARISTNAEDLIVRTVTGLVPKSFHADPKKAELPDPRSPREALNAFRAPANLAIELVAAEPMVQSPVAIDWDAQGRLWVCEMFDYPSGLNPPVDPNRKYGEPIPEPPGGFTPGGRIKILTDTNGDGVIDRADVFLDKIPFPTGVMPWGRGALICAAPDILYAEDTDGDGRADLVRTNITGFATHNFQARVNGFTWGLDGWLHGSSGLFGGKVKNLQMGKEVDLSGRDFRYRPETGELEPVSGISQMGRVRDDFDNWFGNDNSTLLWHYPLPDHYLRRNPHVTYPEPRVSVARGGDANKLFPVSRTLTRFNDPQMTEVVTSACGPGLYRDSLMGDGYSGNAFICEPVHNLVRRLVLEPDGVTFAGRRAPGEERTEFLASTDNWFRPVQARTGPDGALYVVDMYRFVIEHPRWIPPERLKELDVRAGADKGRIYRLYPKGGTLRPVPDLRRLGDQELARSLNSPNGTVRDQVHRELVARGANQRGDAVAILRELSANAALPAVRAQALCALGGPAAGLEVSLQDPDVGVRKVALHLAEPILGQPNAGGLHSGILANAGHSDPGLRFQTALTLGEWNVDGAAAALATLAGSTDRWLRAAVLSSSGRRAGRMLDAILAQPREATGKSDLVGKLIATAVGGGSTNDLAAALQALAPTKGVFENADAGLSLEPWRLDAIGTLIEALRRQGQDLASAARQQDVAGQSAAKRIDAVVRRAGKLALDPGASGPVREAAIRLLGSSDQAPGVEVLAGLLNLPDGAQWHAAVVESLARSTQAVVAGRLVSNWNHLVPSLRARVADVLIGRPAWAGDLLSALERGEIRVSEIHTAQRQRLTGLKDLAVRDRAAKLFTAGTPGGRAEAFRKFDSVSALNGVSERGFSIFEKNCAQCHALRGHGHEVGPNLAEFAGKSVEDFVLAILDPNAGINPNFVAYNVETRDGRSLSGIVRNETASSLTVVQGGGVREVVLRKDVAEIRASAVSLMPEGMELAMTPQEMADLIAWLKGGRPAEFGSATPEQMAKARAEFLAGGWPGGIEVVQAVERLPYPGWLGRWPLAYCRQNAGQERLAWRAKARNLTTDTATFRFPAATGFVSQPQGEFTLKLNGVVVLKFDATLGDRAWQSDDGKVRMTYAVREANTEDSCGVLSIEIAKSMLKGMSAGEFEVTGSPSNSQRWFGIYLLEEPKSAGK